MIEGTEAQALGDYGPAVWTRVSGRGLGGARRMWYTEGSDDVDFTEFRVFDRERRRKTIRVAGY